jgi:chromosome segregation ATPase
MKSFVLMIAACLIVGCGARTEVAKDKVLAKIDSLLGSMDVKRKEIELSMKGLKDGVDGIRKAKIKAQVKHDQIQRQIDPVAGRIKSVDTTLKKLREHLASEQSVEIGGKTYSPKELTEMANKVIQARKDLAAQQEGLQKSQTSLKKVVSTLEKKQQDYQQSLTRLEAQIAEIDSKVVALKAMKDASAAMGDSEESLAENVANLEGKVNDLYAEVESELIGEDARWDAAATEKQINSVEAFIKATQDSTDTISEIDKILAAPNE